MHAEHPHTDVRQLLLDLEHHWQAQLSPRELRQRLRGLLLEIRAALSQGGVDAQVVLHTYGHLVEGAPVTTEEVARANQALKELLKGLGIALAGILPGAFITLPVIYALARHFHVDLLVDHAGKKHENCG